MINMKPFLFNHRVFKWPELTVTQILASDHGSEVITDTNLFVDW